jgi:hypothetical protein
MDVAALVASAAGAGIVVVQRTELRPPPASTAGSSLP